MRCLPAGVLLLLGMAASAPAQERVPADRGAEAAEGIEPPGMATAPHQFRIGVSAGALSWDPASSDVRGISIDRAGMFGLDVERLLSRFVSVRLGASVGRATFTKRAGDGSAVAVNTTQYVLDMVGVLRFPSLRLGRVGLVAFGDVGIGTVLHDPSSDTLSTRSQNAFVFGGGVEASLASRFGVRAEWRGYSVSLEDLFAPTNQNGRDRDASRVLGTIFWSF